MNKPLVTLLCPCYNAHNYIERFLKSLASQTYENVQIIIINDGSKDDTLNYIKSYADVMKKFTEYLVLDKANGGAASAINAALPFVKGEYLTWADCDDILYQDNIRKKVEFLESHTDCGLVVCQAESFVEEKEGISELLTIPQNQQEEIIFERLIHPGVPCYPGVFMLRTELLFERLNNGSIPYHREVGQNWQLLLPVAYDHKCGYLNEPLYGYCIRQDSHSRNVDMSREYERLASRVDILKKVLFFLPEKEYENWMKKISIIFARKKLIVAYAIRDIEKYREQIACLKQYGKNPDMEERLKLLLLHCPMLINVYHKLKGGR